MKFIPKQLQELVFRYKFNQQSWRKFYVTLGSHILNYCTYCSFVRFWRNCVNSRKHRSNPILYFPCLVPCGIDRWFNFRTKTSSSINGILFDFHCSFALKDSKEQKLYPNNFKSWILGLAKAPAVERS